jgi:hypothetical protein
MWLRKVFLCVVTAALLSSSGCFWCHQCHRRAERWRDGCPCERSACEPCDCGCAAPAPLLTSPTGPTMMMPPVNPK